MSIEQKDALEIVRTYGKHAGVCIYADPPYLGATRSSRGYTLEAADEAFHLELLEALDGCKASVVLSGYASELYDSRLEWWDRHEIVARANNDARTEIVWVKNA